MSFLKDWMAQLESMDFTDFSGIFDWFIPVLTNGATLTEAEEIRGVFAEQGFMPGMNSGEDHDPTDSDNAAGWIIGQCLEPGMLEKPGAQSALMSMRERWKRIPRE